MHSRMRVTVLLQRNLLVRSGISIDWTLSIFSLCKAMSECLISARRRRDRREIKLFQGLLHAAQRTTAKITKSSQANKRCWKKRAEGGLSDLLMAANTNSERQTHRTNRVRPVEKNKTERNHKKMTILKIYYIRPGHLERWEQSSYLVNIQQ